MSGSTTTDSTVPISKEMRQSIEKRISLWKNRRKSFAWCTFISGISVLMSLANSPESQPNGSKWAPLIVLGILLGIFLVFLSLMSYSNQMVKSLEKL